MPLPTYRFAILTTSRKLASASDRLASISPSIIRSARLTSSSAVSRSTRPISFKYIRTGSLFLFPMGHLNHEDPLQMSSLLLMQPHLQHPQQLLHLAPQDTHKTHQFVPVQFQKWTIGQLLLHM